MKYAHLIMDANNMRILLAFSLLSLFTSVNVVSGPSAPAQSDEAVRQNVSPEQDDKYFSTDMRVTKNHPTKLEIAPSDVIKMNANDKIDKHNDYFSSGWWVV